MYYLRNNVRILISTADGVGYCGPALLNDQHIYIFLAHSPSIRQFRILSADLDSKETSLLQFCDRRAHLKDSLLVFNDLPKWTPTFPEPTSDVQTNRLRLPPGHRRHCVYQHRLVSDSSVHDQWPR